MPSRALIFICMILPIIHVLAEFEDLLWDTLFILLDERDTKLQDRDTN